MSNIENPFTSLSDDIVLNIFHNLQDDPRHWPRLSSVCTRFSSLIRHSCSINTCSHTLPSDLTSAANAAALHKLTVCCPGLRHAGILLNDTSDFGLHRDLGPDQPLTIPPHAPSQNDVASGSDDNNNCYWSLFDDLYYDTVYNPSEEEETEPPVPRGDLLSENEVNNNNNNRDDVVSVGFNNKRRKVNGSWKSHLASGVWNLSREQGNKLLRRQFRDDCLYVCDWPGCVHVEEKRKYMVFRGVFRDFKKTRVWRTIHDGNRKKVDLGCAFCLCNETWDLHSAFCLRRGFGYHDDGEPVVRAFVCEKGHVSGAWTDVPNMYT